MGTAPRAWLPCTTGTFSIARIRRTTPTALWLWWSRRLRQQAWQRCRSWCEPLLAARIRFGTRSMTVKSLSFPLTYSICFCSASWLPSAALWQLHWPSMTCVPCRMLPPATCFCSKDGPLSGLNHLRCLSHMMVHFDSRVPFCSLTFDGWLTLSAREALLLSFTGGAALQCLLCKLAPFVCKGPRFKLFCLPLLFAPIPPGVDVRPSVPFVDEGLRRGLPQRGGGRHQVQRRSCHNWLYVAGSALVRTCVQECTTLLKFHISRFATRLV